MRKPDVDPRALRALVSRVFPGIAVAVARTAEGTTTQVYRLNCPDATYYLRVAEDPTDRFGAEVLVHEVLADRGVQLPQVVHYEQFDPALDRSVMVITSIGGKPLAHGESSEVAPAVLRAAGRDLALINEIPVAGFGFVCRDDPRPGALTADFPSASAFVERDLESDLFAVRDLLPAATTAIRRSFVRWSSRLGVQPGHLAHGDLDATHIYHDAGIYAGIIDFGEIRGTDRMYDLGHFALRDGERLPPGMLRHLLAGYGEVFSVSEEDEARIWLWTVLIGVHYLARTLGRAGRDHQRHAVERINDALRVLAA